MKNRLVIDLFKIRNVLVFSPYKLQPCFRVLLCFGAFSSAVSFGTGYAFRDDGDSELRTGQLMSNSQLVNEITTSHAICEPWEFVDWFDLHTKWFRLIQLLVFQGPNPGSQCIFG